MKIIIIPGGKLRSGKTGNWKTQNGNSRKWKSQSRKTLTIGLSLFAVLLIVCAVFRSLPYSAYPSLVKPQGTYYMAYTQEKIVALTFDDGPDPLYTGSILDVLKAHKVRATFFVLGQNAEQNPDLLQRIFDEGHEIGNHGYSHSYDLAHFIEELQHTHEIIFDRLKIATQYYRPPGGLVDKQVIKQVTNFNHTLTLWSVDSRDWQNPGAAQIARNVLKNVFPGAIILLHDGGERREQTAEALEIIIPRLKEEGYRFVTLSELQEFDSKVPVNKLK